MTQAPDTTVATAVRQHGGGRHPLNLPCAVQAGRLQDSRGGVINRRAEGATSSHPLPASCAAAAHPTTGVRRARELSPSLRSQSCQLAQLVEGYGALAPKASYQPSAEGDTGVLCLIQTLVAVVIVTTGRQEPFIILEDGNHDSPPSPISGLLTEHRDGVAVFLIKHSSVRVHIGLLWRASMLAKQFVPIPAKSAVSL